MSFPDLEAVTREGEKTWAADASVREEFSGNKEHYLAFLRADAKGLSRTCCGKVTSGHTMLQTPAPTAQQQAQNETRLFANVWTKEPAHDQRRFNY